MITPGIKTLDDALTEIRALINDGDANSYRYTDALVVAKINTALLEIRTMRPDAFIGNFTQGVLTNGGVPFFQITDIGISVPWPCDQNHFFAPVVFYVTGILDVSDDEFADNGRGMAVLAAFQKMLLGAGAV